MTIDIYLSGPIQHVPDYGRGWRQWLKEEYADDDELNFIDPMDKYDTMAEAEDEWTTSDIVEDDLAMIRASDAFLAHWEAVPTAGTPMEIFFTRYNTGIPIAIQTTLHESDISPWIEYHADYVVETFEEALDMLRHSPENMYA